MTNHEIRFQPKYIVIDLLDQDLRFKTIGLLHRELPAIWDQLCGTKWSKNITALVLHRTINKINILIHINYSKTSNKYDPRIFLLRERKTKHGRL